MPADVPLALIDRVRVASRCTAKWEDMTGDERVRRCGECNLKVHNLSAMRREEVEALLASHFAPGGAKHGQRLCGVWRVRADGTMIVGDCPVGLARVRAKVWKSVARVAAMIGLSTVIGAVVSACSSSGGADDQDVPVTEYKDDGKLHVPGELSCPPAPAPTPAPAPEPAAAPAARPEGSAGPRTVAAMPSMADGPEPYGPPAEEWNLGGVTCDEWEYLNPAAATDAVHGPPAR